MNIPSCPIPADYSNMITSAHGGGGTITEALIRNVFLAEFGEPAAGLHDATTVQLPGAPAMAITTDSYVVDPLFFPGGNIGTLAVNGTLNDLLMAGARPEALTASFLLGEGLPIDTLKQVVASMKAAAGTVPIVAGDTKTIPAMDAQTLYINTSGIGTQVTPHDLGPSHIQEGDVIVLTGDIARHGIAVMAERHQFRFENAIASDCANLSEPLLALYSRGLSPHTARDATRGGLGGILCELASASGCDFTVEEAAIPVLPAVRGACDILGLDPLFVANEGACVLIAPPDRVAAMLDVLHTYETTRRAVPIGRVSKGMGGHVVVKNMIGTHRRLTPPSGTQLPRIC